MLIELIIEFELRGLLGPLDCTCTLTTCYFQLKTKISKKKFRVDYHLLLNYLQNFTPNAKS